MYEPWPAQEYPPAWKVVAGFLVAPAIAALLLAAFMPGYDGLPPLERFWQSARLYAVVGAYPPTVVVGIPAYFMLRRQVAARIRNCVLVGATLPLVPWGLLIIFGSSASEESFGNREAVVDGVRTLYGWELTGAALLELAALGAAGGLVFGLIVVGWPKSLRWTSTRTD